MALGSTKRRIIAGSAAQRQTGGTGVRQPGSTSTGGPIILGRYPAAFSVASP